MPQPGYSYKQNSSSSSSSSSSSGSSIICQLNPENQRHNLSHSNVYLESNVTKNSIVHTNEMTDSNIYHNGGCHLVTGEENVQSIPHNHEISDIRNFSWAFVSNSTGQIYPIRFEPSKGFVTFIGLNGTNNGLVLQSLLSSRTSAIDERQAVLVYANGAFHLKDINSSNGTYVNGRRAPSRGFVQLNEHDQVRFGFSDDIYMLEIMGTAMTLTASSSSSSASSGESSPITDTTIRNVAVTTPEHESHPNVMGNSTNETTTSSHSANMSHNYQDMNNIQSDDRSSIYDAGGKMKKKKKQINISMLSPSITSLMSSTSSSSSSSISSPSSVFMSAMKKMRNRFKKRRSSKDKSLVCSANDDITFIRYDSHTNVACTTQSISAPESPSQPHLPLFRSHTCLDSCNASSNQCESPQAGRDIGIDDHSNETSDKLHFGQTLIKHDVEHDYDEVARDDFDHLINEKNYSNRSEIDLKLSFNLKPTSPSNECVLENEAFISTPDSVVYESDGDDQIPLNDQELVGHVDAFDEFEHCTTHSQHNNEIDHHSQGEIVALPHLNSEDRLNNNSSLDTLLTQSVILQSPEIVTNCQAEMIAELDNERRPTSAVPVSVPVSLPSPLLLQQNCINGDNENVLERRSLPVKQHKNQQVTPSLDDEQLFVPMSEQLPIEADSAASTNSTNIKPNSVYMANYGKSTNATDDYLLSTLQSEHGYSCPPHHHSSSSSSSLPHQTFTINGNNCVDPQQIHLATLYYNRRQRCERQRQTANSSCLGEQHQQLKRNSMNYANGFELEQGEESLHENDKYQYDIDDIGHLRRHLAAPMNATSCNFANISPHMIPTSQFIVPTTTASCAQENYCRSPQNVSLSFVDGKDDDATKTLNEKITKETTVNFEQQSKRAIGGMAFVIDFNDDDNATIGETKDRNVTTSSISTKRHGQLNRHSFEPSSSSNEVNSAFASSAKQFGNKVCKDLINGMTSIQMASKNDGISNISTVSAITTRAVDRVRSRDSLEDKNTKLSPVVSTCFTNGDDTQLTICECEGKSSSQTHICKSPTRTVTIPDDEKEHDHILSQHSSSRMNSLHRQDGSNRINSSEIMDSSSRNSKNNNSKHCQSSTGNSMECTNSRRSSRGAQLSESAVYLINRMFEDTDYHHRHQSGHCFDDDDVNNIDATTEATIARSTPQRHHHQQHHQQQQQQQQQQISMAPTSVHHYEEHARLYPSLSHQSMSSSRSTSTYSGSNHHPPLRQCTSSTSASTRMEYDESLSSLQSNSDLSHPIMHPHSLANTIILQQSHSSQSTLEKLVDSAIDDDEDIIADDVSEAGTYTVEIDEDGSRHKKTKSRFTDSQQSKLNGKCKFEMDEDSPVVAPTTTNTDYEEDADCEVDDEEEEGAEEEEEDKLEIARRKIDELFSVFSKHNQERCAAQQNSQSNVIHATYTRSKRRSHKNSTDEEVYDETSPPNTISVATSDESLPYSYEKRSVGENTSKKRISNELLNALKNINLKLEKTAKLGKSSLTDENTKKQTDNSTKSNQQQKTNMKSQIPKPISKVHSAPNTPHLSENRRTFRFSSSNNKSKPLDTASRCSSRKSSITASINSIDDSDDQQVATTVNEAKNVRARSESINSTNSNQSSSMRFNRAFALRRARLGMDTCGVEISEQAAKSAKESQRKASTPQQFRRNDGGRFSLRNTSASNSSKISSSPVRQTSNQTTRNKPWLQNRQSVETQRPKTCAKVPSANHNNLKQQTKPSRPVCSSAENLANKETNPRSLRKRTSTTSQLPSVPKSAYSDNEIVQDGESSCDDFPLFSRFGRSSLRQNTNNSSTPWLQSLKASNVVSGNNEQQRTISPSCQGINPNLHKSSSFSSNIKNKYSNKSRGTHLYDNPYESGMASDTHVNEGASVRSIPSFQMGKRFFSTKPHQMAQFDLEFRSVARCSSAAASSVNGINIKKLPNESIMTHSVTESLLTRHISVPSSPNNIESQSPRALDQIKPGSTTTVSSTVNVTPPISSSGINARIFSISPLDSLVISAINQLSTKLRTRMRDLLERERTNHSIGSETRVLIDEILPQVGVPLTGMDSQSSQTKSSYNHEPSNISRDLSSTLKNLKKVEQIFDVFYMLLEPNVTCQEVPNDQMSTTSGLSCTNVHAVVTHASDSDTSNEGHQLNRTASQEQQHKSSNRYQSMNRFVSNSTSSGSDSLGSHHKSNNPNGFFIEI